MSTPRVVVVDHHDSYTWNLVHLVAAVTGTLPVVVEHDEVTVGELSGFSHVVLSPGPGSPDDVRDFALGRPVFELGLPVLGVCLGMQALVSAYGGQSARSSRRTARWPPWSTTAAACSPGIPSPFAAVRYHSLAAIPAAGRARGRPRGARAPTGRW